MQSGLYMKKIKEVFLFVIILVLFVGVVSATEEVSSTTDTPTTSTKLVEVKKTVQDTQISTD